MKVTRNGKLSKAFLQGVLLSLTMLQLTRANENCTFQIPEECQCSVNQSQGITVECIYTNTSVIEQLLQEPVTNTLDLYEIILTSEFENLPIHFFDGINSVHSIKMANSNLRVIPEAIFHLENISFLDFSNNMIDVFNASPFHHLPYIESVNLRHNKIKNIIDTEILPYGANIIEKIDLSHNSLTDVPEALRVWSIVQSLDLSSNRLSRIPDVKSASLEELVLNENNVGVVGNNALSSVPNLKTLKISSSSISSLHVNGFQGLEYLQNLDISKNSLKNIPDNMFRTLHHLKNLDISHNIQLSDVTNLSYPPHISSLDLSYCAITQINKCQFLGLNNLAILKLKNNKLPCDCEIYSLYTWFTGIQEENQITVHKDDDHWLCVDGTGENVPIKSSAALGSCNVTNQKECNMGVMNNLQHDKVELNTFVDSGRDIIKATWKIYNISTYGFFVHLRTTDDEEITHSPLIHKDSRKYELSIEQVSVDEFVLCLEVLQNNSVILHEVCETNEIPSDFLHMITGIVAGIVFLVPCLAVLFWVIRKDIVYSREQAEYDKIQEKETKEIKETNATDNSKSENPTYRDKCIYVNEGFVTDHHGDGTTNEKTNDMISEITRL